jgi:hypothetical protein
VAKKARAALDPESSYGPADLVVSATRERAPGPLEGPAERLPARETLYRVVHERGPITLEKLAREVSGVGPRAVRAPYIDQPELYLLRLIAGSGRDLPPLCDMQTIVRILADSPGPDPDYGFEVRPA